MDTKHTDLDPDYYPDGASSTTIAIVFATVILIGIIVHFVRSALGT